MPYDYDDVIALAKKPTLVIAPEADRTADHPALLSLLARAKLKLGSESSLLSVNTTQYSKTTRNLPFVRDLQVFSERLLAITSNLPLLVIARSLLRDCLWSQSRRRPIRQDRRRRRLLVSTGWTTRTRPHWLNGSIESPRQSSEQGGECGSSVYFNTTRVLHCSDTAFTKQSLTRLWSRLPLAASRSAPPSARPRTDASPRPRPSALAVAPPAMPPQAL